MKKILTLITLMFSISALAQIPTYKWVSGDEVSTPSNLVLTGPGPRQGASTFTDFEGNFWIYGGFGNDASETQGYFNDLWKYDRADATWTWVSGLQTSDKLVPEYNNSLSFDGIDDRVILDDIPLSYHEAFTIELWFKTTQNGDIISHSPPSPADENRGWTLRLENDTRVQIVTYSYNVAAEFINTSSLIDDEWHQISFSFTGEDTPGGDKISMYIDGVSFGQQDLFFYDIDPDDDHDTMFGAYWGDGNETYFSGQLDEIRFWNGVRTDGEIKSNYAIQLTANEDSLASYYNFNQAEANNVGNFETVVFDVVNSIHGTMDGDIYRDGVFIGEMAKMRAWDYGLSQEEIQTVAQTSVVFGEPGLAMAYNFDEGLPEADNTGVTSVFDITTTNDGFLNNFTLDGTNSNFRESALKVIPQDFQSHYDSRGVVTADLDSDTYDDVIVVNQYQETLSVFINDQTGNLNAQTDHLVGSEPKDLAFGYLNDDNFPDMVVPAWGADPIDLFENGTETFFDFVYFAQFAGGRVDIGEDDLLSIEIRFGAGTQKAHRFTVGGQGGGVPESGYLYQDYVDIPFQVWDTENNQQLMVSFRDQQEDGEWNLIERITTGDPTAQSREYLFIHNVVYAETENTSIAQNGGIESHMYQLWPVLKNGETFDKDNLPTSNLAIEALNDERVRIFFGDGTGGFSSTTDLSFPIGSEPEKVWVSDMNGDGEDDLFVLLDGEDRFEIHYGDGLGGFTSFASFDFVIPNFDKNALLIEDFNNDNYPDIAVGLLDENCGKIGLLINDQSGSFSTTNIHPLNGDCIWADEFVSTDFNNDGNRDLILFEEDYFITLTGNGDGTFADLAPTRIYYEGRFNDITITDVNSDGIEDIIAVSDNTNDLSIHLGDETGGFEVIEVFDLNTSPQHITLADLDKNGILDFVISNNVNKVTLFLRETDLLDGSVPEGTLDFDGVDDYVDIPNLKIFDNSFTIEGWIKTEDNGPIFSFGENDPALPWGAGQFSFVVKDDRLGFLIFGQPYFIADEGEVKDGNWHHIAAVVHIDNLNNDVVVLYLDGNEILYEPNYDFDAGIDNANGNFYAKLGYASSNFKDELGTTGIAAQSNWTDGVPFPDNTEGRAFAAEWTDGETLYVFGGQGANGIYNSLLSRKVATSECPSLDGLTYTYTSINPYSRSDYGDVPFGTLNGSGVLTETATPGQYTFTDFTFGILQEGYGQGDAVGPKAVDFCGTLAIEGSDQFGFTYSITSPVVISDDGTSMTFSWTNTYEMEATTTVTLDAGEWPNFDKWELISGSETPDDPGYYGIQNVSDPANVPPARFAMNGTTDPDGNVWIFGGAIDDTETNYFNDLWKYDPITSEWVWVSGSSELNAQSVYGTMGVSDPANVPGPRSNHNIWSDAEGNIWIFGGYGLDVDQGLQYLNDLWKFDTQTLEWTWVKGSMFINEAGSYGTLDVYDPTNTPGARTSGLQWIDSSGIVWIFGGLGTDKFGIAAGYLNDLWSYDPSINQWAWHSGSDFKGSTGSYNETGLSSTEYVPGARWHSGGWIDENDKLWLFGGYKFNQLSTSLYNDFWNYNTENGEWTWVSGYNSTANVDELGVYGSEGVGSKPHPTGRNGALAWTDNEGNFWMLGGEEFNAADGFYNDLWKYEPQKKSWTYLGGNTEENLNDGVYGSKGIGSSNNDPKSRWHGASWTGKDGKLWFFGGINYNPPINNIGWLNDLWFYDPETNVYTWMGGSSEIDASGVYGIKGEASTSHVPGARSSSSYWSDAEGNFWLFGGYESFEYNNDLWKFNPNTLEWTWVSGNDFQNSPGIYGEKGVPDPTNSIGARRYTDGRIDQNGIVWVFGGDGHDINAQRGDLSDLWKYDPVTNIWTWVSGSEFLDSNGNYGTQGVAHPDNYPMSRYGHGTWIDDSGNVWIFGGFNATNGTLNDLWKFDVRTNMWTWVGGSEGFYVTEAVYGTKGEFSESNVIDSRQRSEIFQTTDKSLWLFGGRQGPIKNDFWEIKFTPGLSYIEAPHVVNQTSFAFAYDEAWTREYQVQVAESDDFSDVFYDELLTEKQAAISDLLPGTYYYYRVNAINEIGESGFSDTQQVLTLPATPEFASLELALSDLTSSQVYLDWNVTEGILDGYYIDVSQDPAFMDATLVHEDFSAKQIAVAQRQEILNLTPGTRYYARLQSFNPSGVSPFSQTVPFLTKPATPTYEPETVLSEVNQTSVLITWNEVPEVLGSYRVTVSTLDDGFVDVGSFLPNYDNRNVSKSKNSLTIAGLTPGTHYYAYISAVNSSGESEQSEKITMLTTPESPVFELEGSVLSTTQTEVTFSWQSPNGIYDGYLLEVSTDFTFANTNLMLAGYGKGGTPKNLPQSQLTETVTGLTPGQTYFTRVRAYNASGQSPNSNIISFTTVPRAPQFNPPGNITQNSASLSWAQTSGSDLYLLDVNTSDDFGATTQLFSGFPIAVPFEVLSDLESGTRYYARVQASNASGNSGSMTPPDYSTTTFITIPATPILNGPDNYTQTSFRVSWPAVEGAVAYQVDASDNFFQTFLPGFNGASVTDPEIEIVGLSPGEEYQVRVRAGNESGNSPNASLFDLTPLPAVPIARDASNISSSRFTANWDPSDGAEYYILEVSLDGFQTYHYNETLNSSNPVQMTDLQGNTEYKYRVKAGNSSGESDYSLEISVVAQTNSQSLAFAPLEFDENFPEGTASTTVGVVLTNGLGNPTIIWRYKGILEEEWSAFIEIEENLNNVEFEITSFMLDEIGVEFEVYANDGLTFLENLGNTIKRSFSESQSEKLPSLVFSEWQMISIPYILDQPEVVNVFNELGSVEYKKGWRIMHYENSKYLDGITGFNNIEIGKGYWFNALSEVAINVGAGKTNTDIPSNLTLNQGWNQIGNPFNAAINWNQILASGNQLSIVDGLLVYDTEEKEFTSSSTLNPFAGAFVWSDQEITVSVFPNSGGRTADAAETPTLIDGSEWQLPVHLEIGGKSRKVAGVGMNNEASELKDPMDELVPPRFENYLEMFTTRAFSYPYFSTDIVPVKDSYVWSYELASNVKTGPATLKWDNVPLLNNTIHIWLVDEQAGRVIKMTEVSEYRFNFSGQNDFTIHYSTDPNYQVLPGKLSLGDAYPNPVNTTTNIPVLLPDGESYSLELAIYDLQGRKMKTIANGEYRPGLYLFELDVNDQSQMKDGIYIYQLEFEDKGIQTVQKKLVIKK
ncbi:MAG: kelch repeat-containing protein [Cyclobacteriaceae bacterium]